MFVTLVSASSPTTSIPHHFLHLRVRCCIHLLVVGVLVLSPRNTAALITLPALMLYFLVYAVHDVLHVVCFMFFRSRYAKVITCRPLV